MIKYFVCEEIMELKITVISIFNFILLFYWERLIIYGHSYDEKVETRYKDSSYYEGGCYCSKKLGKTLRRKRKHCSRYLL